MSHFCEDLTREQMYFSSRGEPYGNLQTWFQGEHSLGTQKTVPVQPTRCRHGQKPKPMLLTLQVTNLEDSPQAALSATPYFLLPHALQSDR